MKTKNVPYHREDTAERSGFRKQTRTSVAAEARRDDTRVKRIRDYRDRREKIPKAGEGGQRRRIAREM